FPSPTFNAAAAWALSMTPAAHKGPVTFNLGRDLQPGTGNGSIGNNGSYALGEFIRNTAIAQGDVLGTILVPPNCIFRGMAYNNKKAVGAAMVLTPSLRGVAGGTFPTVDGNVVSRGFAKIG